MTLDVPKSLADWNARGRDYLPGLLGLEFTRVDADGAEARLALRCSVLGWHGFLHGGTVVSLADTCCGYATVAGLPEGAAGFTTVDLQTNFIATVLEGVVLCTSRPVHRGRTTQVWDAEVTAEGTGKTLAHFRCTQLILWPRT